jgi:hypothetical protein
VCVCVCVRERERERESSVCVCSCVRGACVRACVRTNTHTYHRMMFDLDNMPRASGGLVTLVQAEDRLRGGGGSVLTSALIIAFSFVVLYIHRERERHTHIYTHTHIHKFSYCAWVTV